MKKVQVFLSCYKRHEYTKMVLDCLNENTVYSGVQFYLVDDGSKDKTSKWISDFKVKRHDTIVKIFEENKGLRFRLLEFFKESDGDYICKVDNDCLFEKGWLKRLVEILDSTNIKVIAPNEVRRNPADRLGVFDRETGCYLLRERAKAVGGLWLMKREVLKKMRFNGFSNPYGVKGAWQIMVDIRRTNCKMGFTKEVGFEHVGERRGEHPLSIKNSEYKSYIEKIGREKNRGWWNTTGRRN